MTDRLREIHVPALVLAGGRDQVVPPDATRQVAESLPLARFELDAECGHTVEPASTATTTSSKASSPRAIPSGRSG